MRIAAYYFVEFAITMAVLVCAWRVTGSATAGVLVAAAASIVTLDNTAGLRATLRKRDRRGGP